MSGRFPFDPNGNGAPPGANPLSNPSIRAALGLGPIDEAIYLQRQQEQLRDFQLRQMFLQERLEQQNRLEMLLNERFHEMNHQNHQKKQHQQSSFEFSPNRQGPTMQSIEDIRREQQLQIEQQARLESLLQERMRSEQATAASASATASLQYSHNNLFGSDHYNQYQMNDNRASIPKHLRLQAEDELRRRLQDHNQQHQPTTYQNRLRSSTSSPEQHDQGMPSAEKKKSSPTKPTSKPTSSAEESHEPNKAEDHKPPAGKDLAQNSLRSNARPKNDSEREKKKAKSKSGTSKDSPLKKKRPRSDINESTDGTERKKRKYKKREKKDEKPPPNPPRPRGRPKGSTKKTVPPSPAKPPPPKPCSSASAVPASTAAGRRRKRAVNTLLGIKDSVAWSDSENDDDRTKPEEGAKLNNECTEALKSHWAISIDLPNFHSSIPELPAEPEVELLVSQKKRIGLLDEDEDDDTATDQRANETKVEEQIKDELDEDDSTTEDVLAKYPHPIDPWWPSLRKCKSDKRGQKSKAQKFVVLGEDNKFKADLDFIQSSLCKEVQPGLLEKVPHCKIHRVRFKKMTKTPSSLPELVQCFQVTELYPNDLMVCCSQCSTWRHAACGGHHKPYSIREAMETPFVPLCDRCHVENAILEDYPVARKRLDRQRCEQTRRGLATSAVMRHAALSKYGGTYKWPLGSVSASHIGGHTRSVQSRHDKAEKQWIDMSKKLASGSSQRSKDRTKVRTKELERLLTSVEDAEGFTDRHNMMIFLMQDTMLPTPVGFEKERLNIFDPEEDDEEFDEQGDSDNADDDDDDDDDVGGDKDIDTEIKCEAGEDCEIRKAESSPSHTSDNDETDSSIASSYTETFDEKLESDQQATRGPTVCCRKGCTNKPRFDSVFCSDACGVSVVETDILQTLYYVNDIHPSVLRS